MTKVWIIWEGRPQQFEMARGYDNNEDGWGFFYCPALDNKKFDYYNCPEDRKTYRSLMELISECKLYEY